MQVPRSWKWAGSVSGRGWEGHGQCQPQAHLERSSVSVNLILDCNSPFPLPHQLPWQYHSSRHRAHQQMFSDWMDLDPNPLPFQGWKRPSGSCWSTFHVMFKGLSSMSSSSLSTTAASELSPAGDSLLPASGGSSACEKGLCAVMCAPSLCPGFVPALARASAPALGRSLQLADFCDWWQSPLGAMLPRLCPNGTVVCVQPPPC